MTTPGGSQPHNLCSTYANKFFGLTKARSPQAQAQPHMWSRQMFIWRRRHLKFLSTKSFDVSGQDSATQFCKTVAWRRSILGSLSKCAGDVGWPSSCRARPRCPFSLGFGIRACFACRSTWRNQQEPNCGGWSSGRVLHLACSLTNSKPERRCMARRWQMQVA